MQTYETFLWCLHLAALRSLAFFVSTIWSTARFAFVAWLTLAACFVGVVVVVVVVVVAFVVVVVVINDLGLCRCDYCLAACSGGGSIDDVDVSNENPIPVLDGFGFGLVSEVSSRLFNHARVQRVVM